MSDQVQVQKQAKIPASQAARSDARPLMSVPEYAPGYPDITEQVQSASHLGHSLKTFSIGSVPLQIQTLPASIQRQEMPEEKAKNIAPNLLARTPTTQIQRLIVNTNSTPIVDELKKGRGWIMGAMIKIALNKGGRDQRLVDHTDLPDDIHVGSNENIYLIGHGTPGAVGDTNPQELARRLEPILPQGLKKWLLGYWGEIRSFSCSAGAIPEGGRETGIHGLASEIGRLRGGIGGIPVSGATGVAYSHSTLAGETRAVMPGHWGEVGPRQEAKLATMDVDQRWTEYVQRKDISKADDTFRRAADVGDSISGDFYRQFVEEDQRNLFLSTTDSIKTERT